MGSTRVKICGITRPEDAALASEYGADAIGLNFVGGPRRITFQTAADVLSATNPFISAVGLLDGECVVDGKREPPMLSEEEKLYAQEVIAYMQYLQIYQDPEAMSNRLMELNGYFLINKNSYWPVIHVDSRSSLSAIEAGLETRKLTPAAVLIDTASDKLGGSGKAFNWHWIAEAREAGELEGLPPIILAGGLTPENVAQAIRIARPYAVDVSSGVEVAGKPGVKDPIKVRDFIQAAKSA